MPEFRQHDAKQQMAPFAHDTASPERLDTEKPYLTLQGWLRHRHCTERYKWETAIFKRGEILVKVFVKRVFLAGSASRYGIKKSPCRVVATQQRERIDI